MHRVDARSLSRNADSERFNRGPERLGSSVIKVVFHDRQSQVMGVYTAVLSISGLLGTASVMPARGGGRRLVGSFWQSGDWRLLCRLSGQWVLEAFLCPFQNGRKSVSRRAELPLHFSCGSLLFSGAHLHRCVDDALRA